MQNTEFRGVIRFHLHEQHHQRRQQQSSPFLTTTGALATKCMRVSSMDTVAQVVDALVAKFHGEADTMHMTATTPAIASYSLWEVHDDDDNGTSDISERHMDVDERPLLVQLGWCCHNNGIASGNKERSDGSSAACCRHRCITVALCCADSCRRVRRANKRHVDARASGLGHQNRPIVPKLSWGDTAEDGQDGTAAIDRRLSVDNASSSSYRNKLPASMVAAAQQLEIRQSKSLAALSLLDTSMTSLPSPPRCDGTSVVAELQHRNRHLPQQQGQPTHQLENGTSKPSVAQSASSGDGQQSLATICPKIDQMSAEVADSNPYSRLMALQCMEIVAAHVPVADQSEQGAGAERLPFEACERGAERSGAKRSEAERRASTPSKRLPMLLHEHPATHLSAIRQLLFVVEDPTDWADLKTFNDHQLFNFVEAAKAHGLFVDNILWKNTIVEAFETKKSARQCIRWLAAFFATANLSNPSELLDEIIQMPNNWLVNTKVARSSIGERRQYVLRALEWFLRAHGIEPDDFPRDDGSYETACNELGYHGRKTLISGKKNTSPRYMPAYVKRLKSLMAKNWNLTAKSTVSSWLPVKKLITFLKSNGFTFLPTATTGIDAELLYEGQTVHKRICRRKHVNSSTPLNIDYDSRFAELLRRTHGILIDEISMQHKDVLEYVDRLLRSVAPTDYLRRIPFAGKVIVLEGDWKQLAPVVPGGGHLDQLNASVKNSHIFNQFVTRKLRANHRLKAGQDSYRRFLLRVGTGKANTIDHRVQLNAIFLRAVCPICDTINEQAVQPLSKPRGKIGGKAKRVDLITQTDDSQITTQTQTSIDSILMPPPSLAPRSSALGWLGSSSSCKVRVWMFVHQQLPEHA
ncbi:hypothetical protein niasHT_016554 [Heterodera trifolii]|uniref:ATP-dependent DNA helicase n=1 Tax=Heterodera trifolii TaxID=157864 RepID=A0ABD2LK86_9BILA